MRMSLTMNDREGGRKRALAYDKRKKYRRRSYEKLKVKICTKLQTYHAMIEWTMFYQESQIVIEKQPPEMYPKKDRTEEVQMTKQEGTSKSYIDRLIFNWRKDTKKESNRFRDTQVQTVGK